MEVSTAESLQHLDSYEFEPELFIVHENGRKELRGVAFDHMPWSEG